MLEQEWSEFWWNNITGANLVVTNIVNSLMQTSSVVVEIPSDLPWRKEMRSVVEDEFRRKTGYTEMLIEIVDVADEMPLSLTPGKFLLERFSPSRDVMNGYRERSHKTIQEYIRENKVLKNRIVWVKGLTHDLTGKWAGFCNDYAHDTLENGCFVIETHDDVKIKENPNLCKVRLTDCISECDVQLFNSFIVEKLSGNSSNWKKYIATAAASICETDAEVSFRLLMCNNFHDHCILEDIGQLANSDEYPRRGADAGSNHTFAHYRNGDRNYLEQKLWKAQVQTLFPLIEMERIMIIRCYESELREMVTENKVMQFNNQITRPIELELGTLCHRMNTTKFSLGKTVDERVQFLHVCRNHLAHAHICSVSEVRELLNNPFR